MRKLIVGAAATMALCATTPSFAATFVTSYDLAAGDNAISKFDAANGMLASVTFKYITNDKYGYFYNEGDDGETLFVYVSNENYLFLNDPSFNEPFNSPGSLQLYTAAEYASGAIDLTTGTAYSGMGPLTGSMSVTLHDPAVLKSLTGSGTFIGNLELEDPIDGSVVLEPNGEFSVASGAGYLLQGGQNTLLVTYVTTANSTGILPEPGTWAMMMIGFGMIGFAARNRSSVKKNVIYA